MKDGNANRERMRSGNKSKKGRRDKYTRRKDRRRARQLKREVEGR